MRQRSAVLSRCADCAVCCLLPACVVCCPTCRWCEGERSNLVQAAKLYAEDKGMRTVDAVGVLEELGYDDDTTQQYIHMAAVSRGRRGGVVWVCGWSVLCVGWWCVWAGHTMQCRHAWLCTALSVSSSSTVVNQGVATAAEGGCRQVDLF